MELDYLKNLAKNGQVIWKIKVHPRARQTAIAGLLADGTLKVDLKSAAENNRANEELVIFLAQELKISRSQLEIMSGQTNRNKLIKINF